MIIQDREEFDELYRYVKEKIFMYDDNQSLSRFSVLRLKGLATNKYIDNKHIKSTAHYSYAVILNTFRFCISDILKAVQHQTFADESHKMNYILRIVEPKINIVYERMKAAERAEKKASENTANKIVDYQNTYKKREQTKGEVILAEKFKDLW